MRQGIVGGYVVKRAFYFLFQKNVQVPLYAPRISLATFKLFLRAICILLFLPFGNAIAQSESANSVLYFSAGWRPSTNPNGNVVQIGILFRCKDGWCMDSETIDGRMNIQTVSIPQFHEMKGPHRSINCKDRAMATIQGSVEKDQSVSVKINSDGYEITSPIGTYYWQRVGKTFDGTRDRMKLVAFKELGAIHHSTQVVGEAFSSGNYDTIISLDQLGGRYDGLINHKDMNATSEEDWITRRSIIDFSRFTPNQSASLVRGYTTPGQPDVIKKYGKSMYVQHSVTILNFRSTHMKPILHEYGHDFNDNGCFDEQGHNKLLLPIITGGIVSELVYIEYTPDNRNPKDQVPMLSVGCYFLAH